MEGVDFMELMDLAVKLGEAIELNPVWNSDGRVVYSDGYIDDPLEMSMDLDTGCWSVTTGVDGSLGLPPVALRLMAEMSQLAEGSANES